MLWIKVLNDGSGTSDTGNYIVQIGINDALVYEGRLDGFARPKGWQGLVRAVSALVAHDTSPKDDELWYALLTQRD